MNNFDILHFLKKGAKIRKCNWAKDWYLFINVANTSEHNIESFFVDYSPKMKEDMVNSKEIFDYKIAIDDLIYEKWETYRDDRD